jgi:microcystin-dependent protein
MGDLIVRPSYQLGPTDILSVDKLNLMATPIVELALQDPVNDQNFFRNGNFYSSFWITPGGIDCPAAADTENASYWFASPVGGTVNYSRDTIVPDIFSLFSAKLIGSATCDTVEFGQQINADLAATLRRQCTFSGHIRNDTGLALSPKLNIYTCNSFNNFNDTALVASLDLGTIQNGAWGYDTATADFSAYANVANGLYLAIELPSGSMNGAAKVVHFSRLKFQIGELATEFVDDVSLFVTTPSIGPSDLQDGCIARPALFQPNVIPAGAYMAGSIQTGDIGVGQVQAANLDPGINTTTTAGFTVPAVNANVPISVVSAARISPGLILTIQGAGNYLVVSVAGNVVTTQNRGDAGNASSGTIVNSGASVTTSGNAVIGSLGFTPVNKGGDTAVGAIQHQIDTVVGAGSAAGAAVVVQSTDANKTNDGYFPAIGLVRDPAGVRRSIGLDVNNRLKTVDAAGTVGYIADSIKQIDTSFYQDKSITLAKLADALVNLIIPPGLIEIFGGPTVPTGWLECNGSAVSRTGATAALFNAIGTTWGSGDNVSTFNLPDLRGRSPIGYCGSAVAGITSRPLGTHNFGEETHLLAVGEMPVHNHVLNETPHQHPDPGHAHAVNLRADVVITGNSGALTNAGGAGQAYATGAAFTGLQAVSTGITMNNTGGGAVHNNMQPSAVVKYMIKT